jgi:flagellar protein FliL
MAEEAKKNEEPAAAEVSADAANSGKKKKLILIIAIAAVVVIGGGLTAFLLMKGGDENNEIVDAATEEAAGDTSSAANPADAKAKADGEKSAEGASSSAKESADKPAVGGFGDTYTFKSFHLNLGNPLENNYIRIEISAEFRGGDPQKEEIEKRLPQLRDAVVGVVSAKSREFLLSPDGKAQLRREILIRMNRYMNSPLEKYLYNRHAD